MINKEKLLVVLGVPAEHTGKPLNHDDVSVLGMHIGKCFKRDYVKEAIEKASDKTGGSPEYGISDGAHNLVGGFKDAGIVHHLDISGPHWATACGSMPMARILSLCLLPKNSERSDCNIILTDKAWLLPPNMRAMARFMNLREWVTWGKKNA